MIDKESEQKMNLYELMDELCVILKDNYNKDGFTGDMKFTVKRGRKFFKIIQNYGGNGGSVHAFIDGGGNVYKAASWNAPAKGIRFNLHRDIELLRKVANWTGGYLYAR